VTVSASGSVWTVDGRAITAGKLFEVGANKLLGRHTGTAGDVQEISVDGGLEFHGGQLRRAALTGPVTAAAGGNATTLAQNGAATGNYYKWDGTSWVPAPISYLEDIEDIPSTFTPAAHTHTLSNLTQSGATTGQVAQWNGTEWAPGDFVPKQRYRSFWIGAGAMTPATTAGAAPATIETSTNDVAYDVHKFDGATAESVWFVLRMPDEWDRGTVKAVLHWEPDTGGSGAVTWGIAGLSCSNDDALDAAVGTEVLVSDSVIAVGDLHITAATAAITIAGAPALGDLIAFRIRRVPSDASDTMTQDACLIGLSIQWREGTTEPSVW
jgi:hypothetical protein